MHVNKKISRNRFFKILGSVLMFPFLYTWFASIQRHKKTQPGNKELIYPLNLSAGVHFEDQIIIIKNADKFTVLSSRCTHLGCKINKFENNQLICPCHGSAFDTEGSCVKGPAGKSLKKYNHSIDLENKKLIIHLS